MGKRNVTPEQRFWAKVDKSGDCWEWIGYKAGDYGVMYIDGKAIGAHRMSYQLHSGEIPNGYFICHKCDNPGCVNPDHLFAGTQADNMRDKAEKGRAARHLGPKHPMSKLTKEQCLEIRQSSERKKVLCERYGVSRETIRVVQRGQHWSEE